MPISFRLSHSERIARYLAGNVFLRNVFGGEDKDKTRTCWRHVLYVAKTCRGHGKMSCTSNEDILPCWRHVATCRQHVFALNKVRMVVQVKNLSSDTWPEFGDSKSVIVLKYVGIRRSGFRAMPEHLTEIVTQQLQASADACYFLFLHSAYQHTQPITKVESNGVATRYQKHYGRWLIC